MAVITADIPAASPLAPPQPGWKALALSVGLNLLLFAFVLGVWSPAYETADDVSMMRIASGLLTGHPSEFLVFPHIAYGLLLKALYIHLPAVNWYPVCLYAAHFFAMVAIGYALLRRHPGWQSALVFCWCFCAFEMPVLLQPQFTSAAFVAGLGGLLLLATVLTAPRVRWGAGLAALALLLLGVAIRANACYLLFILATPVLIALAWQTRARDYLLAGGLLIAGLLALHLTQHAAYRAPAWQAFLAYRDTRSDLYDLPGLRGDFDKLTGSWGVKQDEHTTAVLRQAGWSANDARLFINLLVPTAAAPFDTPTLQTISRQLTHRRTLGASWAELSATLFHPSVLLFLLCCLFTLAVCAPALSNAQRLVLGATLLAFLLLAGGMAATAKLPFRLIVPPLWLLGGLAGWFLCAGEAPPLTRLRAWLPGIGPLAAACVFALLAFGVCDKLNAASTLNAQRAAAAGKFYAAYTPAPQTLIINSISGYFCIWYPPCSPIARYAQWPILTPGTWALATPLYQDTFARYHIAEMYLPLLDRPDTYFCGTRLEAHLVQSYLREHYHRASAPHLYKSLGGNEVGLFRFQANY